MFEAKIFLINIGIPSALCVLGVIAAYLLSRGAADPVQLKPAGPSREGLIGTIAACLAGCAVYVAFALRTEFALWHEDAWMRLGSSTLFVAVAGAITALIANPWIRWSLRLVAVAAAAFAVFPQGETWDFLLPARSYWLSSMTLSCFVGWLLLGQFRGREAAVVGLSWIPLIAAGAFLTAQSFLKVTEPLLAASSVLGCFGIGVLIIGKADMLVAAGGAAIFAFAAATASAQFNSYLGLPDSLSWLAMATPALVAASALPLRDRAANVPTRPRLGLVLVVLVAALVLAAAVVAWTHSLTGGSEY